MHRYLREKRYSRTQVVSKGNTQLVIIKCFEKTLFNKPSYSIKFANFNIPRDYKFENFWFDFLFLISYIF